MLKPTTLSTTLVDWTVILVLAGVIAILSTSIAHAQLDPKNLLPAPPSDGSTAELLRYLVVGAVILLGGTAAGVGWLIKFLIIKATDANSNMVPVLQQMQANYEAHANAARKFEEELKAVVKENSESHRQLAVANASLTEAVNRLERRHDA